MEDNQAPLVPALSEATINRLLDQQAQEATLRSQELAIRKQELDYQSKHASDILGAQERDREAQRLHTRKLWSGRLRFVGFLAVVLLAFAVWGIWRDKEAVVKDILQIVLGFAAGAMSGYGIGRAKKKSEYDQE